MRGPWRNFSASFNESDRSAGSIELDGRWNDSEKAQVEEVNQIRGTGEGKGRGGQGKRTWSEWSKNRHCFSEIFIK